MDNTYLMTPVIEVDNGAELKSFRMYNLYIIAFFFGLLPVLLLFVRNGIWLRMKTGIIVLLAALSVSCLVIQYSFLGIFYYENSEYLQTQSEARTNTTAQQWLDRKNRDTAVVESAPNPATLGWQDKKSTARLFDRACSVILLTAAYFLTRRKYKVVANLTGTIQPIFKWGIASVLAAGILEKIISVAFFGGLL